MPLLDLLEAIVSMFMLLANFATLVALLAALTAGGIAYALGFSPALIAAASAVGFTAGLIVGIRAEGPPR